MHASSLKVRLLERNSAKRIREHCIQRYVLINHTGEYIGRGSCGKDYACKYADGYIGDISCKGYKACYNTTGEIRHVLLCCSRTLVFII